MIDRGHGTPLIIVPGIQGRCEWMRPLIHALADRYRVLSFSLNETRATPFFGGWSQRIDALIDRTGAGNAHIAGVSFGGLVALHYAAHRAERTRALVLVSPPSPRRPLDDETLGYLERPWRALPRFMLRAGGRLAPELRAGRPTFAARTRFSAAHAARVLRYPQSPARMAAWVRAWMAGDLERDARQVAAPTLVVTGEPELDRVVPVSSSLDYLAMIPSSRAATLTGTGHLGFLLNPAGLAEIMHGFLAPFDRSTAASLPGLPLRP